MLSFARLNDDPWRVLVQGVDGAADAGDRGQQIVEAAVESVAGLLGEVRLVGEVAHVRAERGGQLAHGPAGLLEVDQRVGQPVDVDRGEFELVRDHRR
jgi:hypothetical protein